MIKSFLCVAIQPSAKISTPDEQIKMMYIFVLDLGPEIRDATNTALIPAENHAMHADVTTENTKCLMSANLDWPILNQLILVE